jgi:pimeloyl-ACP methyl ester carboxylesterase
MLVMTKIVLVPGAWLGAWAWSKVVPLLAERGHYTYPVTLTGEGERVHLATKDVGIETAIQDVLNVIKYNDLSDFVLVGHSFAGKVVAAVADRVPEKVRTLLYLDAFRPAKVRIPQGAFNPEEYHPPPGSWTVPFTEEILNTIGKDVKGADREGMLSKATPWPMKHANEPITLSENFDTVKSAYIFCTDSGDYPLDEILQGKWGKLDGPYKVIESGHWPMITKPSELVEDILALTG